MTKKKIKLLWTFGDYRITQLFGLTDFAKANPTYYPKGGHTGLDFGMPHQTPVYACHNGEVVRDSDKDDGPRGISVCIVDPKQLIATHYLHLSINLVDRGQKIKAGDIIGYSGNTGLSTAPHLHFGLCLVGDDWMRLNADNETNGFIDPYNFELVEYWRR